MLSDIEAMNDLEQGYYYHIDIKEWERMWSKPS